MTGSYGSVQYWEERYQYKEEQYEWYLPYESLRFLMKPDFLSPPDGVHPRRRTIEVRDRFGNMVPRSIVDLTPHSGKSFPTRDQCRVLIVGCGNSTLGEDMMMDGWSGGIVNVDFSPTVIQQMNRRYSQTFYDKLNTSRSSNLSITCQPMTFCCADVTRQIPYPDESFDLVVVKGALDAILCSSGSIANARRMMKETCRVLRSEHGAMMVVTNGNPDNRLVYFENEGDEWWDGVSVHTIPRPAHKVQSSDAAKEYYVYISRKRPGAGKGSAIARSEQLRAQVSNLENSLPMHQVTAPLDLSKPTSSEAMASYSAAAMSHVAPSGASQGSFTTTMLR